MPFNLGDFFRRRGAKVEHSKNFNESDLATSLGTGIEARLISRLATEHPETKGLLNAEGGIDSEKWAIVKDLAEKGNKVAQELVALDSTNLE